jgi:hypothetical protein
VSSITAEFRRARLDAEARTGFARLRRVPDTRVRQLLDYYETLGDAEKDAFADAATGWRTLEMATPDARCLRADAAWARWENARQLAPEGDPYRYHSVPNLRLCVAQAKMDRAKGIPPTVPKDLEEYAASVRSPKASELRKHVRVAFKSLFDAEPHDRGGGDWVYEGNLDGSPVSVHIDYGSRASQLRYSVGRRGERICFERLLGVGLGWWNFIVEENVDDSVQLLSELVSYLSDLPRLLESFHAERSEDLRCGGSNLI